MKETSGGVYTLCSFSKKLISESLHPLLLVFADILHMEIILNEVAAICQTPVSGIMNIFNDYNICTGCLMLSSFYRLKSWRVK